MPLYWGAVLVAVLLSVGAPAALALRLRRRFGVSLRVPEVAAAFYLVNLLVQVPVLALVRALDLPGGPILTLVATPAILAVCEESLRYMSFRASRAMRENRTAEGALMAGLGHGGMEAVIFDLSLVWTMGLATFAPDVLRASNVELDRDPASVAVFLAAFALGRLAAVAVHVGLAALVVLAYRRSVAFLAVAVAAHVAVDASTLWLQALSTTPLWVGLLVGWAVVSLGLVRWAGRGPLRGQRRPVPAEEPATQLA